mmetsp:Transcript_6085/g.13121  ORF Transcript_6085/g.13121 Transcript_6085/m.13121 type:complete len:339 (+) Transcript_6085:102-1118(+)
MHSFTSQQPVPEHWVRDEEVNDCQICGSTFGSLNRKHHCRECGKVVCGTCSGNTMFIANLGKDGRACDKCFALSQHDKASGLTESFTNNRKEEKELKANLKEKVENARWFDGFLKQVAETDPSAPLEEVAAAVAGSSSASNSFAVASPRESVADDAAGTEVAATASAAAAATAGGEGAPEDTSVTTPTTTTTAAARPSALEGAARARWREVVTARRRNENEVASLKDEYLGDTRLTEVRQSENEALEEALQRLEQALQGETEVMWQRDQLRRKVETLKQELTGLQRRGQTLQDQEAAESRSFGSFVSLGTPRISRPANGNGLPPQTCVDRARGNCSVM